MIPIGASDKAGSLPRPAGREMAHQCLTALNALMTCLTEEPDIAGAGPRVVRALGENLGWDLGVITVVDQHTGAVLCRSLWRSPSLAIDELEWIADVSDRADMSRLALATRTGLHEVAAFPLLERGVLGLIEFFDRQPERPAEQLSDLVVTAGALVGQFIARCRTQEALARAHEELEARVRERTTDLLEANRALERAMDERQKLEQRLRITDRLAAIGTLAAGVAHEINNPMAYVVSNLEFIERELCDGAGQATAGPSSDLIDAVGEAKHGAERVRRIVRDLRVFSRAHEDTTEVVDPVKVLESSINFASATLRRHAQVVRAFDAVPQVDANECRLGQVFLNLLINAAQAIPAGHPDQNTVRIATRTDPTGRALIEISDSGCGIAPCSVKQIFDPFFTTKPPGVGTGLGLSIVHGIVTSFRGEISVESELGKGTTFRIALPAARQR